MGNAIYINPENIMTVSTTGKNMNVSIMRVNPHAALIAKPNNFKKTEIIKTIIINVSISCASFFYFMILLYIFSRSGKMIMYCKYDHLLPCI